MEHYLTKEKQAELEAELKEYKSQKRLDVAARLKAAKELGDLSENAEYHEAREEQRLIESHIAKLEDRLRNATVITMKHGGKVVRMGTTFNVTRDSKRFKFTLVGADDADPASGRISNESPLGQAFLSKKVGETVTVETPSGKSKYKITSID